MFDKINTTIEVYKKSNKRLSMRNSIKERAKKVTFKIKMRVSLTAWWLSFCSFFRRSETVTATDTPPDGMDDGNKEYSLIWYKKMQLRATTHYTRPYKTKVREKNLDEAKEKVCRFTLSKMTLQIFEEKDFDSSEIMIFQKKFEKLNTEFNDAMEKVFNNKNDF